MWAKPEEKYMVTPGDVFNIETFLIAVEHHRGDNSNVAVDYAAGLPEGQRGPFWDAFRKHYTDRSGARGNVTYINEVWVRVFEGVTDGRCKSAGVPTHIRQQVRIAILEKEKADLEKRARRYSSGRGRDYAEEMCNCMPHKGPHPYGEGGPGSSCA